MEAAKEEEYAQDGSEGKANDLSRQAGWIGLRHGWLLFGQAVEELLI